MRNGQREWPLPHPPWDAEVEATVSLPVSRLGAKAPGQWEREPPSIQDWQDPRAHQQASSSLPSTCRPLLRRKASCLGSRPRKSFSMMLASLEPPGFKMQLL